MPFPAFLIGGAFAKLPPPSDEAKAKAAETAHKAAWSDKVAAYHLCQTMDKVASAYRAHAAAAGKAASAAEQTPPCTDPGPYAAMETTPAASKPLEASEAHSPPGTATTPAEPQGDLGRDDGPAQIASRVLRLTAARAPLTREIEVRDEFGAARTIAIPAERALTVFVDNRELVTLMTLGAEPELLVLGYLRNQRLVERC